LGKAEIELKKATLKHFMSTATSPSIEGHAVKSESGDMRELCDFGMY
jgi:hypothetical protein